MMLLMDHILCEKKIEEVWKKEVAHRKDWAYSCIPPINVNINYYYISAESLQSSAIFIEYYCFWNNHILPKPCFTFAVVFSIQIFERAVTATAQIECLTGVSITFFSYLVWIGLAWLCNRRKKRNKLHHYCNTTATTLKGDWLYYLS